MMWITRIANFFACSTQVGSSMVSMIMSSMNPSVEYYRASMSTASVFVGTNIIESGRYYYLEIKFLCGDWSYNVSHEVYTGI